MFTGPSALLWGSSRRKFTTTAWRTLRRRPGRGGDTKFGRYERLVPRSLVPQATLPLAYEVPCVIPYPSYATANTHVASSQQSDTSSPAAPTDPLTDPSQEVLYTSPTDLHRLRRAGRLAARTLRFIAPFVKPGVTTTHLDQLVYQYIIGNQAYPSPLGYHGFPRACCISVNNVMAHGIPDDRPLQDGDIINIDITVFTEGFHGDTSQTFLVGQVDSAGQHLVQVTQDALHRAIAVCKPGAPLHCIGDTIERYARQHGLHVAELLAGHGIGRNFHTYPAILHHANNFSGVMKPGMVFTIEPALCQGETKGILWPDRWTVATSDGGRSAQSEHTILITTSGCDILTLP
ncbi:hypothetical protein IWQ61_007667 [Dispira simplex]|nr:hypothetical protein IWQ61_007667 [Dispira simplex]